MMPPVPTCPSCGAQMVIPDVAIIDHQTAPWLCNGCHLGFWEAELTEPARNSYRPQYHDWGHSMGPIIRAAAEQEAGWAKARGTSVHDGLRPHLTEAQAALLDKRAK